MLKLSDLALRPDLQLGPMLVSPSRRLVEGPGGHAHLEPLIMQVFLLLLEMGGKVVTRSQLFDHCWGGVVVGDDSLNRAIAKVRRTGAHVAPGLFEIETIPRTGYRITGQVLQYLGAAGNSDGNGRISRRLLLGGGAAAAAAVAGSALWWTFVHRPDARFDELMKRGEEALRDPTTDYRQISGLFEEATALNPDSARAWGLIAMVKAGLAVTAGAEESSGLVDQSTRAAARALAIDPAEPNALLAMAEIEGTIDGWASFDQKLRHILAIDPGHLRALSILAVLTQGAGLNRESWALNERAIALEPLSPHFLSRRALKLWIFGRVPEADRVIDRLRELWPMDPWAFYVRLQILALTGRARAARAMLDGNERMIGPPASVAMWRASIEALEQPTAARLDRARRVILDAARAAPGLAAQGVMILSSFQDVDSAFDVTDGLLLSRGPIVLGEKPGSRSDLNDPGWRWTPWLFTPPTAAMRADPRFLPLCDGIGLVDYWKARGVRPDYLA